MKTTYPLTSKSQITVPKQIREHLGLKAGDRAVYRIQKNGDVVLGRPPTPDEIMARAGKPTGKQPLTDREKVIVEQLTKKHDLRIR